MAAVCKALVLEAASRAVSPGGREKRQRFFLERLAVRLIERGNVPSASGSTLVLIDHHHVAGDGEQANDEVEDEIRCDCAVVCHDVGVCCLFLKGRKKIARLETEGEV